MKRIIPALILALSAAFFASCQMPAKETPLPLEIQAIQKREFETGKKIAFASVVSVLQDLGYIIANADFETGLITASSPTQDNLGLRLLIGVSANSTTKVSAFVEELGEARVSVRLNFVVNKTTSSSYGQTTASDTPILDANVYIDAFNKIENAIFVRS